MSPSPLKASQTRWWDGTTWRSLPFKFATPPYFGNPIWVDTVPLQVGNYEFTGEAADVWSHNALFGSTDTPHYDASGFVYIDTTPGLFGGVDMKPVGTGVIDDPRLNVMPLAGSYTQEARMRVERLSAGATPGPATFEWAGKRDQDPLWTIATYSTTQPWTVYTRNVSFNGSEYWGPRVTLDADALGQTAVFRLSIDRIRLLDAADQTVARWGRGGNFAVRTAAGWMWY